MSDCVFCDIENGLAPANVVREWPDCFAITPLNPVTPGHILVIPREHVEDFAEDPAAIAITMYCTTLLAQDLQYEDANVIASMGPYATQTVRHLHLHLIPRTAGDGLALPWTGQTKAGA